MEWISTKDRFPDQNGRYLVCYTFCGHQFVSVEHFATNLRHIDKIEFAEKRHAGFYGRDDEWGYYELNNVTHWLPLPESPKMEDNDEA